MENLINAIALFLAEPSTELIPVADVSHYPPDEGMSWKRQAARRLIPVFSDIITVYRTMFAPPVIWRGKKLERAYFSRKVTQSSTL